MTVEAPHAWDGVGQALRCAFADHSTAPPDMASVLRELDQVD